MTFCHWLWKSTKSVPLNDGTKTRPAAEVYAEWTGVGVSAGDDAQSNEEVFKQSIPFPLARQVVDGANEPIYQNIHVQGVEGDGRG